MRGETIIETFREIVERYSHKPGKHWVDKGN